MVNNMGIDPDEWFDNKPHPHDSMPVATDKNDNKYAPPEKMAELEKNPRPEEEVADWFAENPDDSDEIEKEKTIHHKMYEIATSKYNPFAVGGSENIHDFDSVGGSEEAHK
tara:strand:- start:1359 stop:1691 length:333 start_codon:yes stop_codon:yes gene_type:complete